MNIRRIMEKDLAGFDRRVKFLNSRHEMQLAGLNEEKEKLVKALAILSPSGNAEKKVGAEKRGRPGKKPEPQPQPRQPKPEELKSVTMSQEEYEKLKEPRGGQ